jgi:AraC-like DNA-binding protein
VSVVRQVVALSEVRVRRSRHVAGVETTAAGVALREFPLHLSSGMGICVKVGPAHQVVAGGRRLTYPADAVCLRAPGCLWESRAGWHGFVSIDLPPELVPELGSLRTLAGGMVFGARTVASAVGRAAVALDRAESVFEVEDLVARLLLGLCDLGAPLSSASRPPAGAVSKARDHLVEHLHLRPSLEETARAAGVDRFALVRRFREEFGATPHAYLVRLRLARAQSLLGRGHPASEAASMAGFADQAHLSRWFRRVYGVTPSAFVDGASGAISFKTSARSA